MPCREHRPKWDSFFVVIGLVGVISLIIGLGLAGSRIGAALIMNRDADQTLTRQAAFGACDYRRGALAKVWTATLAGTTSYYAALADGTIITLNCDQWGLAQAGDRVAVATCTWPSPHWVWWTHTALQRAPAEAKPPCETAPHLHWELRCPPASRAP